MSKLQDAKDRLIEIKEELRDLKEARKVILSSGAQEYTTSGGREVKRPDLEKINKSIQSLRIEQKEEERIVARLSGKGRRSYGGIPRDL